MKNIRLKKWAELNGYTYRGAYNAYVMGNIPNAFALPSGTIVVPQIEEGINNKKSKTIIYSRVSSPKQKSDLDTQANRLVDFCIANGWEIDKVYKEMASGLNDNRKIFNDILDDTTITRIIVEHKDRLTRFGFNYIERLLKQRNCEIIVVNNSETDKEDLMSDFVSLVTSMVARLYGQRKAKRKTEYLIEELNKNVPVN